MAILTYADILAGIGTTLREIEHLSHPNGVQVGHAITESFPDLPMAQVYPESSTTDDWMGNNDRSSFAAGVRVTTFRIVVDIAVRARSHIGEDMKAVIEMADEIQAKMEEQRTRPYFGVNGIMGFNWRWERVVHQRGAGDGQSLYPGLRLNIEVRVH